MLHSLLIFFNVCFFLKLTLSQSTWRSVYGARLCKDLTTNNCYSSVVDSSSYTTLSSCNSTCQSLTGQCLSFAYDSSNNNCILYDRRFGFNNSILSSDSNYWYYEKPIDIDDTLGDLLEISHSIHGYSSYLSYYREPTPGYVDIDSNNFRDYKSELSEISSAEECAKYCTDKRGVIDSVIGTRCDSFNYDSVNKKCHLLSKRLQGTNTNYDISIGFGTWYYYERLIGEGCWLIQENCRKNPTLIGIMDITTSASISWEYQCMAEAKNYHENLCDGYVEYATVAYWGAGNGVFNAWNSWDTTTGCVINLNGTCDANDNSRFSGTFRDSIGEEQFAASLKKEKCFERVSSWFSYCNFNTNESSSSYRQISASYPDTNSFYYYPSTYCTCNNYGLKIDPASGREFCTRDTNNACYRINNGNNEQDYYTYPDILCDDIGGCNTSIYINSSHTNCYLLDFYCSKDETIEKNADGHYEITCPSSSYNAITNYCNYTQEQCLNEAYDYHVLCENDRTDFEKMVALYLPTGEMSVYPDFKYPAEQTLIEGLNDDAAYTPLNSSDIDLTAISQGRYMTFTAKTTSTIRSISIYYQSAGSHSLTLSLYKGEGTTSSILLATSTLTYGPTSDNGDYIYFPVYANVEINTIYTWQITGNDLNQSYSTDYGYIGYVDGNGYSYGAGDLTWDFVFVTWVEYWDQGSGEFSLVLDDVKVGRPWFEIWCITGIVLWFLFALFLCLLHIKRKREEKNEKEEEKKLALQMKKRARMIAKANEMDNNEREDSNDDIMYAPLSGNKNNSNNNNNNNDSKKITSLLAEEDIDDKPINQGNK